MNSVDARRQIATIRPWFPFAVVSVLLAAGTASVVSSLLPKVYEAEVRLIVGQSLSAVNPGYNQILVSQRVSTTYATMVTTRPILDTVVAELGLNMTPDDLLRRVRADAPLDGTLLTISAQDSDPARAAAIANALAEQLIAALPVIHGPQAGFQESIISDLQATRDQINATQAEVEILGRLTDRTAAQESDLATLQGRLVSLSSTYASLLSFSFSNSSNLLSVVEPAAVPTAPISPRPALDTLLAAVLGLLLATGVAAVSEYLEDPINDPDEVREVAGLSTLGTIARMKGDRAHSEISRLATLLYPRSDVAEAYRTLRTNLGFASVEAPIRTLLVTSSIPGEGKTVTAANLAVVFAQAGRRVLLVDADLRKPGIHLLFELPNENGLTTLLRSETVSLDAVAQSTEQTNLRVLTTGPLPPNPTELLSSRRMRALVERLQAAADLVVFDSPPLQVVTDSAILSSFLGSTLLVVDADRGRRGAVRQGREALAKADANVLGVVLNRTPARSDHARDHDDYFGSVGATEKLVAHR